MADRVSWETLRPLASFRARRGCAISMYLDLDPSLAATPGDVATRIHSLLIEGERHEAAKSARLSHDPLNEGESRDEGTRVMFPSPLTVYYRVDEETHTVEIGRVILTG